MYPEIPKESINDIIKIEGYVQHQLSIKKLFFNGDSYLADLYEVNIKGETVKGNKETNIFVKTIIQNKKFKIFSLTEAYNKECYFYKELSNILDELQNEAKVPTKEKFYITKSYDATNNKAIYLENLMKSGFKTLNRMDVMPLEFVELAVQHLAKFHALFYVLQRKRTNYFNKNLSVIKQPYIFNEDWEELVTHMSHVSINTLSEELKTKVADYIPKTLSKFPLFAMDTTSLGCTICHGDYRINNILVKYTNGKFTKVVPVDYQLLHYGCPVHDLIYLIFLGSDQEFRRHHLIGLKNLYYDHLETYLGYFDLNVETIFPRVDFERRFKERLDLGLILALYWTPFLFTKEDQDLIPDVSNAVTEHFVLDDRHGERIRGIVEDFVQWGYL